MRRLGGPHVRQAQRFATGPPATYDEPPRETEREREERLDLEGKWDEPPDEPLDD